MVRQAALSTAETAMRCIDKRPHCTRDDTVSTHPTIRNPRRGIARLQKEVRDARCNSRRDGELPWQFRASRSLNDERRLWATNAEPATFFQAAEPFVTCRSPLPC